MNKKTNVFKSEIFVWLISLLILSNGILLIFETFFARYKNHTFFFSLFAPFNITYFNRIITTTAGFTLIYLSLNLLRRKLAAWVIINILLSLVVISHIGTKHFFVSGVTSSVLILILLVNRKKFSVRSEISSITRAMLIVLCIVSFVIAYGTIGFWLLDKKDFLIDFTITESFTRTIKEFILVGNNDLTPHTRNASWFLDSLDVLGISAIVFSVFSLFRPITYKLRFHPHDLMHMQYLLDFYGSTDLDYFKLEPDKSYFFSKNQKCAVAYKTTRNVAVCLGDPVGPQIEIETAVEQFLNYCRANGWKTVFISVSSKNLQSYKKLGLRTVKIGEEAYVNLKYFFQSAFKKEDFGRQSRKFDKKGYTTKLHNPPHPPQLLEELQLVSKEWLDIPGHKEFSFALGKFSFHYLNKTPLFTVHDDQGKIIAFVNLIPTYQKNVASIDIMRYIKEAPNGTMDYLFTKLFFQLKNEGYDQFNLGLAPFSGLMHQKQALAEEQVIKLLLKYFNRIFSLKGLRDYKAKFDPTWHSRYIAYSGTPANLIQISLAIAKTLEG